MTLNAALIFVLMAAVAFLLEAFAERGKIAFTPLAWAFFMLAILFGLR